MDHAIGCAGAAVGAGTAGEASARTDVRSGAAFAAVTAALGVVIMGNNLPSPLYRVYQAEWGFSAATLTAVFAVAAVAVLPTLLLFGSVSDGVGRRRVLLLALAFAAASAVVFLAASGVAWLVAGRLLAGVGIGLCAGTAGATLAEVDPGGGHERAALTAAVATVVGQAVAPVLAGVLAQYVPGRTTTVFVVDLVLLVLVAAALLRLREPVADPTWSAFRPKLRVAVPAPARPAFVLASLAAFGAFAVMGVVAALGPTFAAQLLHQTNLAVGGAVVFLLLAASAVSQLGARRVALAPLFVVGPLLLVAGLALIVVAVPTGSVAVFAAGTAVAGVGQGLSYVAGQRLLDAHVDAADRSAAFSSFFIVLYVGTALGALGVGLLAAPLGFFPAVVVVSVIVAALALATAVASRRVLDAG